MNAEPSRRPEVKVEFWRLEVEVGPLWRPETDVEQFWRLAVEVEV